MAILEHVKQQIAQVDLGNPTYSEGRVVFLGDGIATIEGLRGAAYSEVVKIYEDDVNYTPGLVFNLEETSVGVILLEENMNIRAGARVQTTGEILSIDVSDGLLGRNISILGTPLDGKGDILHSDPKRQLVEKKGYGIIDRQAVNVPLETGILAVDALIPIGRGQRQLIIGDRQTGKTALALDAVINQGLINKEIDEGKRNAKKVYSIYVAIGQKKAKVAQIINKLNELDVMKYTVVLTSSASDPASTQYLAPYVGAAIGEFFM